MKFNTSISKTNLGFVFAVLYFVILVRTAWTGDDAVFTFRSILNFLNGYGPNFNINERVQAYTHPLWFMLLTVVTVITKNTFTAAYVSSIFISITSFWILLSNKKSNIFGVLLTGLSLLLSKAYIDYSTSGLENPLTNLLVLCVVFSFNRLNESSSFKWNLIFFAFVSSVYLSRSDAIILIVPLIFLVVYNSRGNLLKIITAASIGLMPIILWSLFSLFYYGSAFPNTAYAKLNTGIPEKELLLKGVLYFIDSIGADPITLVVIFIGIFLGIKQNNKAIAIGIASYLFYILYIGGDFMSGRFFATPMLLSAYLISISIYSNRDIFVLLSLIFILGMLNIRQTFLSDYSFNNNYVSPAGIADERGYYYNDGGLLRASDLRLRAMNWPKDMKQNGGVITLCSPAMDTINQKYPFDAHFIIDCALADPLLSRLPINLNEYWRIGHYYRKLPNGYKESILSSSSQITDSAISPLYDALIKITREDLWSVDRFKAIFLLNFTNRYDPIKLFLRNGIEFNHEPLSYFVTELQGASGREEWGRWSDTAAGKPLVISLLIPLPKKFTLIIEAKGFSHNIGQLAIIKIGNVTKRILLEKDIKKFEIPFEISSNIFQIEIFPFNSVSPNQIDSKNQDTRNLGIGIKSISFSK